MLKGMERCCAGLGPLDAIQHRRLATSTDERHPWKCACFPAFRINPKVHQASVRKMGYSERTSGMCQGVGHVGGHVMNL